MVGIHHISNSETFHLQTLHGEQKGNELTTVAVTEQQNTTITEESEEDIDQSKVISVRCDHCCHYYSLGEINQHKEQCEKIKTEHKPSKGMNPTILIIYT